MGSQGGSCNGRTHSHVGVVYIVCGGCVMMVVVWGWCRFFCGGRIDGR